MACVDHKDISPIYGKWLAYPRKKISSEYPRMVHANLNCIELVDILYSEIESPLGLATSKAKELAIQKLAFMKGEEDWNNFMNQPELAAEYMNNLSPKLITRVVLSISNNDVAIEEAIREAEFYFNYKIHKRENLIKVLGNEFYFEQY